MKIELMNINEICIAKIISKQVVINSTNDALDIMVDSQYMGADRIIIYEKNLSPEFFDLKTGIAGEILQKFSNYKVLLAIVGDFSKYPGKSLHDFIRESNKSGRICFVRTVEEAKERLTKN